MSGIATAAQAVEAARLTLSAAARHLADTWRDNHHLGFEQETITPVENATRQIVAALSKADQVADSTMGSLRELSGEAWI